MSNAIKYKQTFDFLSAPFLPTSPEPAVAYGRSDRLVAVALGDLIADSLVSKAVITGGVGKDTQALLTQGYRSEAQFLNAQLWEDSWERGYKLPDVWLDEKALHRGENARNSVKRLGRLSSTTAVAHATQCRSLAASLEFAIAQKTGMRPTIHRKPTAYTFNPENPSDQAEAARELLILADWSAKGWLLSQPFLPEDLIDFARDVHGTAPEPVSSLKTAVLHALPRRLRLRAIQAAAKAPVAR
ncbi:MAG TPA: hypothetical protein VLE73_04270 [Candidatus Saccharimonadales bacterium]|nr:hypothetical protein [Candidatus Saccharimonadales bacterium]